MFAPSVARAAARRATLAANRATVAQKGAKRWLSPSASFGPGGAAAAASAAQGFEPGMLAQHLGSETPLDTNAQAAATAEAVVSGLAESDWEAADLAAAAAAYFQVAQAAAQSAKPDRRPADPENWDFTDPETYKQTMAPPHEAYTIHPVSYKSEAFFKVEQEKVFANSWVCIGLVDEVRRPGDTIVSELAGQPIFAVRDKNGQLNGFLNVCRHRGSKLVKQSGRYPVISCPYHRWGYGLDGRLLATPLWDTTEGGNRVGKDGEQKAAVSKSRRARQAEENARAAKVVDDAEQAALAAEQRLQDQSSGACDQMKGIMDAFSTAHIKAFDKKDFHLFDVRVDTWGPFVFATLSREIPSLVQSMGDLAMRLSNYPLHELVSVRSKRFESKSNWKLLAENFMEYYHLPTVHPALTTVSAVDNHHRLQGPGQYIGFVTNPLTSGGQPIDPDVLPCMPGIKGEEHTTGVFHHLFPNAFYFLLPSHMFTVRITPVSAGLSIEHADLLVHPDLLEDEAVRGETAELNAKIDAIMEFYRMVNQEDIDACELVQEGVQSRAYEGGRVSFRFEETIHRFQNMLIDHMVGKPGRIPKGDEAIPFYVGGLPDDQAAPTLFNPYEMQ